MISIVILHWNKEAYSRRCLESLLFTEGVEFEIIAVDNGSTDGTAAALLAFRLRADERGVPMTVLLNDHNAGAAGARNQALGLCRGTEVAFIDNDIVVRDRGWLARLRKTLYADTRTALVTPKLLFPFPPYDIEHIGVAISPNGRVGYLGRGAARTDPQFNTPRELQNTTSACVLTRRAVLDEVGHFDETFDPAQFEDLDLFYRMKAHGYRLLYEPSVEMYHFENVTTDGSAQLKFKYLTIKHGMEFKRRWQHLFTAEEGPADEALRWEELPRMRIDEIGELEMRG
jgi:GT2 family glycosyltransferase